MNSRAVIAVALLAGLGIHAVTTAAGPAPEPTPAQALVSAVGDAGAWLAQDEEILDAADATCSLRPQDGFDRRAIWDGFMATHGIEHTLASETYGALDTYCGAPAASR